MTLPIRVAAMRRSTQRSGILGKHHPHRRKAGQQKERIDARTSTLASPNGGSTIGSGASAVFERVLKQVCFFMAVLLFGLSTLSLKAQGERGLPIYFNNDRDIPPAGVIRVGPCAGERSGAGPVK